MSGPMDAERGAVRDLLDLTGQVVVVSGASRGIGQGVAMRLAQSGADVVVGYHKDAEGAARTVAEVERQGRKAVAVGADVATQAGAEALVGAASERFGRLDGVVNNAGIYPLQGLLDMSEAEFRAVVDANLTSVFLMTQAAAKRMVQAALPGAIVNISSIEGAAPAPMHSHYVAAKAAVTMHTQAAALELGPSGIRVNAVAPGLTFYPELPKLWPDGVARYEAKAPLGRLVGRYEVADACLFLLSEAASGITGVCLTVDAGISATPRF